MIKNKKSSLMKVYLLMAFLYRKKVPFIPGFLSRMIRVVYACEIPTSTKIPASVVFKHNGMGVVIHPRTKIGENVLIYQNVTLGGRHNRGVPTIGNNVFIGAGAKVLGGVKVGDNARIGANAVVVHDVEANVTVVGIPAKPIQIEK